MGGEEREDETDHAANEGKQNAFEKHESLQVSTSGAKGDADSHLAITASSLREKKIGDVGSGNAEDQKNDNTECAEEEQDGVAVTNR